MLLKKLLKATGPQRKVSDPLKRARALEQFSKATGKKASFRWKQDK